jgi:hypothetical protein
VAAHLESKRKRECDDASYKAGEGRSLRQTAVQMAVSPSLLSLVTVFIYRIRAIAGFAFAHQF